MTWNESSYEYAEARSSEYFGHLPEQMFEHGAKWQRDQLRTDEAIERVARAMAGFEPGGEWPSNEALGGNLTGTRDDEYRDGMREQAKEAITALLGDN